MVEKFPQAKLIKAVGKNGTGKALIEVKGMKQEVSGTYKINGHHVEASFPMKLKGLDITDVRYMGVGVKDEVIVSIDIPLKAAVRKAASTKKRK